MVKNVAPLFAELEPEDFYLLSGVEHGMRFSEWVDQSELPELSGLTSEAVEYRLERALKRKLIEKRTLQYTGYRLTFEGYDTLALRALSKGGSIEGLGAKLGVGKESDVYEVQSYRPMALKFHRESIGNFRNLTRLRDYTADRDHISGLYTARIAAEREFEVLEALFPDVAVPRPVDHNRHAIVMERIDGDELSNVSLEQQHIRPVVKAIFTEVTKAYEQGFVHADLSEYNIFLTDDGVVLFDWPQAVDASHPNASELLERDISTLLAYVSRKHPSSFDDIDEREICRYIEQGSPPAEWFESIVTTE